MACTGLIRVGDKDTSLEFVIQDCTPEGVLETVDITGALTMDIHFKRQDGTELTKPGSIFTGGPNGDGTDGIVQYVTEDGFITEADIGTLTGVAEVVFSDSTGPFNSSTGKFKVKGRFQ